MSMEYNESGFKRGTLIKIAAIIADALILLAVFPYQVVVNRRRGSLSVRSLLLYIVIRISGKGKEVRCSLPGVSVEELKKSYAKRSSSRKGGKAADKAVRHGKTAR